MCEWPVDRREKRTLWRKRETSNIELGCFNVYIGAEISRRKSYECAVSGGGA